jgi:hypothetical protein
MHKLQKKDENWHPLAGKLAEPVATLLALDCLGCLGKNYWQHVNWEEKLVVGQGRVWFFGQTGAIKREHLNVPAMVG